MSKLKRTVDPVNAIISTADMKTHLRVSGSTEDDYIDALVAGVSAYLDGYQGILGRPLITQTWQMKLDAFPAGDAFALPLPPVQSVTHVKYYDTDNVEQTMSAGTDYVFDDFSATPMIVLPSGASWPSTYDKINAIEVQFIAGYGDDASDLPANIVHAAKMLVAHHYENRETTAPVRLHQVPDAAQALLAPWKYGVL